MTINEKKLMQELIEKLPSFWLRLANHMILALPFGILGLFFFERAGFEVFSFEGINLFSITIALACALIHVAVYYLYFKKYVSNETYLKVEKTRKQVGILTRILYGGVVEEVIFRFGLMTFFFWVCNLFLPNASLSFWIANIIASILFALAHLPGVYQMKVPVTRPILIYTNGMNIMVGIFCGWLYWKEGLAAAILCHMLFHFVWFLFEKLEKQGA